MNEKVNTEFRKEKKTINLFKNIGKAKMCRCSVFFTSVVCILLPQTPTHCTMRSVHLHPRWRARDDANFESFEFFARRTHLKLRLFHANIFVPGLLFVLSNRGVLLWMPSTISLHSGLHVSPSEEDRRGVGGDSTHVNISFDLFEYKPSRPCATVTFSSGNTKSGSNAEAAPAASVCFGIVCE